MTDLIQKLEEVRDALYSRIMDNQDEYIDRGDDRHYWIRLNRAELKTVDDLVADEIRKLQMSSSDYSSVKSRIDFLYGILDAMSNDE